MMLQCNVASHWLGEYTKLPLHWEGICSCNGSYQKTKTNISSAENFSCDFLMMYTLHQVCLCSAPISLLWSFHVDWLLCYTLSEAYECQMKRLEMGPLWYCQTCGGINQHFIGLHSWDNTQGRGDYYLIGSLEMWLLFWMWHFSKISWCCKWHGNLFCISGPLWWESTSHRCIALRKV